MDSRKPKIEGSLKSRPAWMKKQDLISKITSAKRAGGVAQSVEPLPRITRP
jgi:hypothetical protein